jgi:hypothetical protein
MNENLDMTKLSEYGARVARGAIGEKLGAPAGIDRRS